MNSNKQGQKNNPGGRDIFEIDLLSFAQACLRNIVLIVIVAVIFAGMFFCYAHYNLTPMYRTSAMLYVNNNGISLGSLNTVISSGDISAARNIVKTYLVILKTRNTLEKVIEQADLPYSYEALSGMISADTVNGTEVFQVMVSGTDPEETCLIANTICDVLPEAISEIVAGSSVRIVDYAVIPRTSYGPNYTKYGAIGFAVGAALAVLYVFVNFVTDDIVHGEEDITSGFDIPLLAGIPDLAERSSGDYGYSYGYGGYSRKSKKGGRR